MRSIGAGLLAACAVALGAAVLGDAVTEAATNLAAGYAVDGHQEALVPGAVLAAVLLASVCALAIGAGRSRAEAFARILESPRVRAVFFVVTALAALAIVVAMEGYEMRFGGVSAFDPRSVLAQHLIPTLATYACIAALADRLLRACVRMALSGWEALLRAAEPCARRVRSPRALARLGARDEHSLQSDAGRTHPSWSLRAPPVHRRRPSVARFWRRLWSEFARPRTVAQSPQF